MKVIVNHKCYDKNLQKLTQYFKLQNTRHLAKIFWTKIIHLQTNFRTIGSQTPG